MKRYLGMRVCAALAAFAIVGVAEVAEADFLIILRNGSEIKVRQYEEVGDQIVYKRYGGKMGIPKTRVATIKNLKTGEKQVFDRFGSAQDPKPTPRETRAPARKSPAKPAYAQGKLKLWNKLNAKAGTLYQQGRYAEAAKVAQEALKVAEKTFGADHPNLATSLNNLALMYQAQGQYAAAEPLYQRALAIREKALRKDHPDVAISLNNLGTLYQEAQGQYAAAEPLYQRALAIQERSLGPDHPDVAECV